MNPFRKSDFFANYSLRGLFYFLSFALFLSSCTTAAKPTASYLINQKLESLQLGMSQAQALQQVGNPDYIVTFPSPGGDVQVVGYELGNYWHHEPCQLVFKNQTLKGVVQESDDLLKLLYMLKAIPQAEFMRRRA